MASAAARKKRRYAQSQDVYGNLAYAPRPERAPQRGGAEVLRPQPKSRPREQVLVRPKVQVREAGQVSLFAVVGFLAVGACAVLLMLGSIQLTMVNDQVVSLREELSSLETEEAKLMAQHELIYDLSEIEEKVTADGSMVKPQASQIYALDLSEADNVVHYETDAEDVQGPFAAVEDLTSEILSYLP